MKRQAIVETATCQRHEVVGGQRRVDHVQLELDRPPLEFDVDMRRHARPNELRRREVNTTSPRGRADGGVVGTTRVKRLERVRRTDPNGPVGIVERRRQRVAGSGNVQLCQRIEDRRSRQVARIGLRGHEGASQCGCNLRLSWSVHLGADVA